MYSKEILNNLTNEEKLNALCRSRNIDKKSITSSIIDKIRQSDIEDKSIYVGEHEIWDREYITYTLVDELYIDYCIECADGLNIDLSEEEKEFLILAKDMSVAEISVESMR